MTDRVDKILMVQLAVERSTVAVSVRDMVRNLMICREMRVADDVKERCRADIRWICFIIQKG